MYLGCGFTRPVTLAQVHSGESVWRRQLLPRGSLEAGDKVKRAKDSEKLLTRAAGQQSSFSTYQALGIQTSPTRPGL